MDIALIIGVILGMAAMVGSIAYALFVEGSAGGFGDFISIPSFGIVAGGMIASIFVAFPMPHVVALGKAIGAVLKPADDKMGPLVDTACEVARSSGGNGIHTHSAVIDEQMTEAHEKEWDKVIRKTIDEERFYLVFQPIICLAGDTSKRYEALLRIVDEEGHTILPGQFLSIAEKSGFISEIDYRILDTAFRKLAELKENGDKTTMFIKLSRAVLADPGLSKWICRKLKEYQLAGSSVAFEIQEVDAANDLKSAITFIKAMKKLQCSSETCAPPIFRPRQPASSISCQAF